MGGLRHGFGREEESAKLFAAKDFENALPDLRDDLRVREKQAPRSPVGRLLKGPGLHLAFGALEGDAFEGRFGAVLAV
eukprot:4825379-Pyramimonas_sp.AAC.1